jgi:2-phospho-L-lactate guanylyltransferase
VISDVYLLYHPRQTLRRIQDSSCRPPLARATHNPQPLASATHAAPGAGGRRAGAGAWGLLETSPGLNPALTQAARFAQARGASGVLILPVDLPRLTAQDLETMLALGATSPAVVIAPCRHETGTNALLVCPPALIQFAFGPDSFAAHCAAARAAGVEPLIYRADGIAFDLDTPDDWGLEMGDWRLGIGDLLRR